MLVAHIPAAGQASRSATEATSFGATAIVPAVGATPSHAGSGRDDLRLDDLGPVEAVQEVVARKHPDRRGGRVEDRDEREERVVNM